MATPNIASLQRMREDNGAWETLSYRYTLTGGVLSDHLFDIGVPTNWGAATYRILVQDNNGNSIGISSIVAVALAR